MPVARHIFGRDKPSLTALAHGGGAAFERRRALALQQLFAPFRRTGPTVRELWRRRGAKTSVWRIAAWRVLLAGLPIVAVILALTGGGSADCHGAPRLLRFGDEADAVVNVSAGWACPLWFKLTSQSIDDLDVMSPPRRGTLAMRGRSGVVYRAERGFTGLDTFALGVRGASATGEGIATIRVLVSVQ